MSGSRNPEFGVRGFKLPYHALSADVTGWIPSESSAIRTRSGPPAVISGLRVSGTSQQRRLPAREISSGCERSHQNRETTLLGNLCVRGPDVAGGFNLIENELPTRYGSAESRGDEGVGGAMRVQDSEGQPLRPVGGI